MTSTIHRPAAPAHTQLTNRIQAKHRIPKGPAVHGSSAGPAAGWPVVVAAAAVGITAIGYSYRLSGLGASAHTYYAVFWLGMFAAVLPAAAKLLMRSTSRIDRCPAVLLLGVVTMVPKLLRNPDGPRYHDEFAHWREAIDVAAAGRLFQPNTLIPIVEFFPGTSGLTVAAQSVSGMSAWAAGLTAVATLHICGLFAMFVLGERLLGSSWAGGVAACVYGLNPSAVYFDTQYAYESLAVNLFLWVLALSAISAMTPDRGRRRRTAAAAALLTAAIVVTHHLTTVFLIVAVAVVAGAVTVGTALLHRRDVRIGRLSLRTAAGWWASLGTVLVIAAVWIWFFAHPTLDYLSPYFGNSVDQLQNLAHKSGSGGRKLLAASVQPLWERMFTAGAPAALLGTTILAAVLLRRRLVRPNLTTLGFALFGLLYFVSLPFILAPSGAEGARRSWGFVYVGIALIVAIVVTRWPAGGLQLGILIGRRAISMWSAVLTVVLLVGNVAGGLNDPYRFPGPFRWGTDSNSVTQENRALAEQMQTQFGRAKVVSDMYTALQLAADGGMFMAAPSLGFPAWELTQTDTDPSAELAGMLVTSEYRYLVVNAHMGRQVPFNGHNFGEHDPLLGDKTPMSNLDRLDSVPWATRVLSTENIRVYRLHLDSAVEGE